MCLSLQHKSLLLQIQKKNIYHISNLFEFSSILTLLSFNLLILESPFQKIQNLYNNIHLRFCSSGITFVIKIQLKLEMLRPGLELCFIVFHTCCFFFFLTTWRSAMTPQIPHQASESHDIFQKVLFTLCLCDTIWSFSHIFHYFYIYYGNLWSLIAILHKDYNLLRIQIMVIIF